MIEIVNKEEFFLRKQEFIDAILKGAVFIYPTDTIYGIGCNALDNAAVAKIRAIKRRADAPFSVIAPSKEWITDNCIVDVKAEEWIAKLPGPYTLVLKVKSRGKRGEGSVSDSVTHRAATLGIRIPDHWFSEIVSELGVPIVTTSVNESGERHATSAEDIPESISKNVKFIIDEGVKKGSPSTVVNLESGAAKIKERK